MDLCRLVQRQLPQYIADGEPALPLYASLRAHLASCHACSTYAAQLRLVENALHTYPLVAAGEGLGERIRATVDLEGRPRQEEWHLWQWDLWIPAIALVAALIIATLSLPPGWASWGLLSEWANTPLTAPQALPGWVDKIRQVLPPQDLPGQNANSSVFWGVWIGIFVTTAGLGISLSLATWGRKHSQRLNDLESQVSDLATRVWTQARHAR